MPDPGTDTPARTAYTKFGDTKFVDIKFDDTGIERVVADSLRFRQKLRIGEEAYALLRAKNFAINLWDTAGAAATGAALASSSAVASTFFAPTGLAAMLGLATAATPVGWVAAAAVVAGGGYYGVSRWMGGKGDAFVDTIPKYITTPIDVLGAALVDLLGSLALRVAAIDGHIDPRERACIADHLVHDWGFDHVYVSRVIDALALRADETRVKLMAAEIAQFTARNPDCNAAAMLGEIIGFLRELIMADGILDEREELAVEAIERVFAEAGRLTLSKAAETTAEAGTMIAGATTAIGSAIGSTIGSTATAVGGSLSKTLTGLTERFGTPRSKP